MRPATLATIAAAAAVTAICATTGTLGPARADRMLTDTTPGPTVTRVIPAPTVTVTREVRVSRSLPRKPHRSAVQRKVGVSRTAHSGHRPVGSWLALAKCESGANLRYDDGTFQGAYNFLPSTWDGYTHGKYGSVLTAGWAEQTYVAWRIWRNAGWSAFPDCGVKLGHPSMPAVSAP